jgi:hypothetical protein
MKTRADWEDWEDVSSENLAVICSYKCRASNKFGDQSKPCVHSATREIVNKKNKKIKNK